MTAPPWPAADDTGSGPSLRGLGWGVLALVVAAVVLFAAVLGNAAPGRSGDRAAPGAGGALPPIGAPAPPLRGAWDFDEAEGAVAADLAGTAPARLRDGTRWIPDGRAGAAVAFDGAGGHGATDGPVLDTAGSYTVSAWVRLDRRPDGAFGTAVSQDGGRDSAFFLQYVPTSERWSMSALNPGGIGVRALSTDPAQAGRWTHLTGVRDVPGGRLILYVDGVRQSAALFGQRQPSAGAFTFGRALFGSRQADFFPGAVDGVRAYGGALSDEQVRAVYESGR